MFTGTQLLPVAVVVDGEIGVTVWAPAWTDTDGEETEGFLGVGRTVAVFRTARDLGAYLRGRPDDPLARHPAWPALLRRADLRAAETDTVDFDAFVELVAQDPAPDRVAALARTVQLGQSIAGCCGDDYLVDVLDRGPYQSLLGGPEAFAGRGGARAWEELGRETLASWDWVSDRIRSHLAWYGAPGAPGEVVQHAGTPWAVSAANAPQQWAPAGGSAAVRDWLPSLATTIVVTLLFGPFGLIPAAMATGRASAGGVRTGRYWAAFGWTLLASFALGLATVAVFAVATAVSGP